MPKHAWQREESHPVRRPPTCRVTGNHRGIIRKYGLMVGRRTFREIAADVGFKKYN